MNKDLGIRVVKGIQGTHLVVFFDPFIYQRELYIEVLTDERMSGFSFISIIENSKSVFYECVPNFRAPERIIRIMRNLIKGEQLCYSRQKYMDFIVL